MEQQSSKEYNILFLACVNICPKLNCGKINHLFWHTFVYLLSLMSMTKEKRVFTLFYSPHR